MLKGSDMAKHRQGGLDTVASMPWPMGIVLGLLGYIAIRHGIGWYFGATGSPVLSGLGKFAASGAYAPIAWVLLVGCWIAAIISFAGRARRRKLLDSQTGIDSLRQINWQQFEQLVGEAFRRQGYAIEETGLGGADGGIDLILRKNGQTTLVQCKQWQNRQVGVKIVREMYGLLVHQQAAAVKIVALGDYTDDARCFAQGKPIELIHGGQLIAAVRSLQTSKTRATGIMDSPLVLSGTIFASLLAIAALSTGTTTAPPLPVISPPIGLPPATPPIPAPMSHPTATPPPQRQAVIYASNSQNDAQLREWKKRHAESMRILERTTKQLSVP